MHDLGYFRANFEAIAARLATRSNPPSLDTFRDLDARRRAAIHESEQLKARRNAESAGIPTLRKQGVDTSEKQKELREIGDRIAALEEQARALDKEFQELLAGIPNIPHESVPVGRSAEDNVEVRRCGEPRQFDFTPKPHWDIGPDLGILDLERAAKVTGARFAVYWGLGAKLERVLINFMLDTHTREHGYTEVLPPFLINSTSLYGTGNLPKFAEDLFKCEGHDLWLAPTAEVPVTNLYRDETLPAERLPISLCAYTPCFRSEAGSYGRDVRGIIRQHQFQKVEKWGLINLAVPEESLEKVGVAESILRKLGLPFRTVELSTGDMGFSSAKTYDIEVWLPGLNEFKEISSCSNFEAFQARRAGIRFKGAKGKSEFAHTLNGSGLAIGRTWVAIVENYQRADGSVEVPAALQPYLNAELITKEGALG